MRRMVLFALFALLTSAIHSVNAAVADTIAERVKPCTVCHGPEGRPGPDAYYPRLAGKPRGYLYNQLRNFREGRRYYRPMALLIENLSDEYLNEMAAYFSSLSVPYPAVRGMLDEARTQTARRLVTLGDPGKDIPSCMACHGKALMGIAPDIPGLLGLPADYINAQFGAWRVGSRHAQAPDCMAEIAKRVTAVEASAISAWLAIQPVPDHARPDSRSDALPLKCGNISGRADQ